MIKFLIILFSVIYLGGLLVRWFMRKWITKMTQSQQNMPTNEKRKEGEVTINYANGANKKKNSGEGDYIDYEEVK